MNSSAVKDRAVTLFVPGFTLHDFRQLKKISGQKNSLSAFELLLSRGSYCRGAAKSLEQTLSELFAVANTDSSDFPAGALTRYLVKGNVDINKWAMRADPVYIQPNREHLVLLGNSGLDLSFKEAEEIVSDINQTYHDTAWQLIVLTAKQWIIEQEQPQQIHCHSLREATGKNINDYMVKGSDEKKWHGLMNELQMLLHAHPVNQQRQMQGLPTVNSLWFWGSGMLPAPSSDNENAFVQCWSDETISLALSRLNNVPRTDLPEDAQMWLKQAITPGKHFIFLETLDTDLVRSDPLEWWQSFSDFVAQWLTPMVAAIKQNGIGQLNLVDERGNNYQLTPRLAKRWWKPISRI